MIRQLDHYRLLGRSGLRVSPFSLGTMTFGAGGTWSSSEDDAARMVDTYIDRGGNFIDTANFYGQMGESERITGRLIKDRRERVVLATKYTLTTRPGDANASGNSRKSMVRSVEDSLRRLGTDYIDLLYLHMWDFRTPVEEILRAFDDLIRQGKVLYPGLSDIPAWQASRMQAIADVRGWSPIVALQISYSLVERTVERDLIPMARELGMGIIPWSPLGGGVLSGKYSRSDAVPANETFKLQSRKDINVATGRISERNLDIAEVVGEVARELNRTPSQVALAWVLRDPAIASPIIGARTHAQFEENLGALEIELGEEQLARLDAASAVEPGFPHDMLQSPAMMMTFGGVIVEKRG